jgi:PAS domain S-box-containing protein
METLLLLIDNAHDRRRAKQWVQKRYRTVEPGECPDPAPFFDLCIIDRSGLNRSEKLLAQRKADAGRVFLPVLLVANPNEIPSIESASTIIDEIITTPLHAPELCIRVKSLLHARRLSQEIRPSRYSDQRGTRQSLAASKELHKAIIACSPLAIYSIDTAGRVTSWNESAQRIFGWTAAEVLGRSLPIVQADRIDEFAGLIRRVLAGEILAGVEVIRQRKDGSLFAGSLSCSPLHGTDGEIIGIMAMMEDITARKQVDEVLRESEEQYRAFFENSMDAILLTSPGGSILAANPAACRMFDKSEAEIIRGGRNALVDLPDPRLQVLLELRERTGKASGELTLLRRGNLPFPAEISSALFQNHDGQARTIMVIRDLTGRLEAENARKASDERFRLLVENAPDSIIILVQGKIAYLNNAAVRLMGASSAQEILDTPVLERFPPEYRETVATHMLRLNQTRQPIPALHLTGLRLDGSPVEIEVSAVPFQFAGQDGVLTFVRDLSERNKAERERQHLLKQLHLAQRLESVGRLAGGVAHDFNNLLSIILGYGEIILDEIDPEHPHHEPLTQMVQAGLRARNLTRQLLAYSRKQILEMNRLDLNEVVTGFEKLLRRVIGEDIVLELALAPAPLPIKGDTTQLEQVLMNLAVNARDAMPEGGRLTIATAAVDLDQTYAENRPGVTPGPYAMIAVSDTGCGMGHDIIEHIFDPFFTTKGKDKGTGLGLATSYGIVKQHGGNIWVYSEPGLGATFRIYLPLAEDRAGISAPAPRSQELSPGTATVLVVEDDPLLRQLVARILSRKGYTVIATESVEDALEKSAALDGPLHLVLTDVVMPSMKGPEVADRIRSRHPEARVLYMSGYADDVIARHGILMEGIQFIQKPFTVDGLLRKIDDVLNRNSPP